MTLRPLLFVAGAFGGSGSQASAIRGLYHRDLGIDNETQMRMRLAQRVLDIGRRGAMCEDESKIARAFRQRHEALVGLRGHPPVVYPADGLGSLDPLYPAVSAALGNRNHHHAGGRRL